MPAKKSWERKLLEKYLTKWRYSKEEVAKLSSKRFRLYAGEMLQAMVFSNNSVEISKEKLHEANDRIRRLGEENNTLGNQLTKLTEENKLLRVTIQALQEKLAKLL
jgi:hypothetical protein